ncbi:MAG: hypothetical protein BWY82_01797 [Verrucomicrobia bacterium ADurb.Bin474]|nr:MAG: hypothetical protein BWY82_01797 [Verrucomicrobia bacterium ADurb.Bin474]
MVWVGPVIPFEGKVCGWETDAKIKIQWRFGGNVVSMIPCMTKISFLNC